MAKRPSSQAKKAQASRAKATTAREALKVLEGVGVNKQEFGKLNKDGTVQIDLQKLEELKRTLGEESWGKVRFVALNAPFKRRSPITPA